MKFKIAQYLLLVFFLCGNDACDILTYIVIMN